MFLPNEEFFFFFQIEIMDDDSLSDDDDQLDLPNNNKHIASIQLGQVDIDCWYHSPYIQLEEGSTEKDQTIAKLFICEFCLRYFLNQKNYRQHTVDLCFSISNRSIDQDLL